MKRYANKSEVLMELAKGGHIESHDLNHFLITANGEFAWIRYSLWRSLTGRKALIEQAEKQMRPPSRLPFFIYRLKATR